MSNFSIIRTAKIKSLSKITTGEKHNKRNYDVPNANPSKSDLNKSFVLGNAKDNFQSLVEKYDLKLRKNGTPAIEILTTFSNQMTEKINIQEWAKKNIEFVEERFGGRENILSADLHMDETTPHMHFIVAPIVTKEHTYRGKSTTKTTLSAKHYIGGHKDRLSLLQDEYAKPMAKFGLIRGVNKEVRLDRGEVPDHKDISTYYGEIQRDKSLAGKKVKKIKDIENKIKSTNPLNIPRIKRLTEQLSREIESGALSVLGDNKRLKADKNKATKNAKARRKKLSELENEIPILKQEIKEAKSALEATVSDSKNLERQLLESELKTPSGATQDELSYKKRYEEERAIRIHLEKTRSQNLER